MARKVTGSLYKRGAVWWVTYQVNGERLYHSLKVTTKDEAKVERDRFMAPLLTSNEAERRRAVVSALRSAVEVAQDAEAAARPRHPIAKAWDHYPYTRSRGGDERELAPGVVKDYRAMWARFEQWAEAAKVVNMEDVTPALANAFRESCIEDRLTGGRVNMTMQIGRVVFDLAGVKPNPFAGMKRRARVVRSRRELTAAELGKVCATATGELRMLLAVGLYTGLRLKDAANLAWEAIALDLSTITVTPAKTAHRGRQLVIPVHPDLRIILGGLPRGTGPIMPDLAARYASNRGNVARTVIRHFVEAGITTTESEPGPGRQRAASVCGFHALRHSFVSILARSGTPEHVARELVGHSSATVHQVYEHANGMDTRKAIAALPAFAGAMAPPTVAEEPERAALRRLADVGSIEVVRSALAGARAGRQQAEWT